MDYMAQIDALGANDADRAAVLNAMNDKPSEIAPATVAQWRSRGRPSWRWAAFLVTNPAATEVPTDIDPKPPLATTASLPKTSGGGAGGVACDAVIGDGERAA